MDDGAPVTGEEQDIRGAPASRNLATYLARLRLDGLPGGAAHLLKLCILDHVGCAVGSLDTDCARAMLKSAALVAGQGAASGPCSIIGGGYGSPETAALTNGTLSHILIFDDLHRHAKLHPGVAVIPAALAAAELSGADGATFLIGVAAGYEAVARVGVAVGMASHRMKGWRATGTCGSFGATVAAARVLGLDGESTHQAIACAAAQASGAWAFQEHGGMELYLSAGTAARNGVTSASLAAGGFSGAADPLNAADGGFFMLSSDEADSAKLDEELGSLFRLRDTCIKMYPTCHSSQTGIDAAIDLRAEHGIGLEDVARVTVRAGAITKLQCGWDFAPAPPSKMIFHMGFAIAVALREGCVRPRHFEGNTVHDPALVRLAKATEVIADDELTAIYADRKPCDVTLYLRDGRELRRRVDYCRGEPENPPTDAIVMEKFKDVSGNHLSAVDKEHIADIVLDMENRSGLVDLTAILRGAQ